MKFELKIKSEDSEINSQIEEISRRLIAAGLIKPVYVKITKNTERKSLSEAAKEVCPKRKPEFLEPARKKLERNIDRNLQKLQVDSHKDSLKMSSGKTSKYQFSEEDMPYLKILMARSAYDTEDIILDAEGMFGCFYRSKNTDIKELNQIGRKIFSATGISNADYRAVLKQKFNDIEKYI